MTSKQAGQMGEQEVAIELLETLLQVFVECPRIPGSWVLSFYIPLLTWNISKANFIWHNTT